MRFLLSLTLLACGALMSFVGAGEVAPITAKKDKDKIDFLVGSELVTSFHTGSEWPKQILWPVNAPGGTGLTRAWPMVKGAKGEITVDHPHHRSIWVGHVSVTAEGLAGAPKKGINFWEEPAGHGNVICTEVSDPVVKGSEATVTSKHEWRWSANKDDAPKDGALILHEDRVMVVKNLGAARLIAIDFDLYPEKYAVTFGDDKDGFFGTRIRDEINGDKSAKNVAKGGGMGKIQNAEGKIGEKECWGLSSAWCDYSGPIDGKTIGFAVLVDPRNTVATSFHVRDYGLLAANPFGRNASFPGQKGKTDIVKLKVGEHLKLRYGVVLHQGDAEAARIAEHFKTFVAMKAN